MIDRRHYCKDMPHVEEHPMKLYRNTETGDIGPFDNFWYQVSENDDGVSEFWINWVEIGDERAEEVSFPFTVETAYHEISRLVDALAERRSDISEMLDTFLKNGKPFNMQDIESRYITAEIPAGMSRISVMYDTLTTHLEYTDDFGDWHTCENEEYTNDGVEESIP